MKILTETRTIVENVLLLIGVQFFDLEEIFQHKDGVAEEADTAVQALAPHDGHLVDPVAELAGQV